MICVFAIDRIYFLLEQQEYQKALDICNEILKAKAVLGTYKNEALCEKQFCEMMLAVKTGSGNIAYSLKGNILKERLDPLSSYHTIYAHAIFVLRDKEKAMQAAKDFNVKCRIDCNKGIVEHEKFMMGLLQSYSA